MKRTIVFGDIHGCIDEWEALMKKLEVTEADRLISVGDLVCKGPSTKAVLDLAMSLPNLECIPGNHDLALLTHWRNETLDTITKAYQIETIKELGDELDKYMSFIEAWPLFIKEEDFLVVHAGFDPSIPLEDQDPWDLVTIRTLPPDNKPWYESYTESKLIVHGHWAMQGLVVRDNVIGLDTGCVYGGELTAVILPERQIVSVKANKAYQST